MIKDLNPSCDYKHCKSFFQINFSTMKWTKSVLLPIPISSQTVSDEVKFINSKGEAKYKQITSVENYLYYKTSDEKIKWIDIENSIIELFQHQKYGQGIRLVKCFDTIEMFCDTQSWFKYLKRYTIQSDFHSNYILRKKIGKGKFSEVYRAKNKVDGNDYAIKIYQKSNLFDDVDRAALQKEIAVLRRMQSEFIIKYYEVFENIDQIFVVLELLTSGNLMDYIIKENFFSEEMAAKIIFRLVKAVNYIHSKNVIHRDIKPENLVFRLQDNIETLCIKKFQLADFYNPDTNYHYVCCGTPGFIAPEILLNQPYDQKVDVFSIGVVLYILMTGQIPFDGSFETRLEQNVEGLVDFNNANLSHIGMKFLSTTLQPNPEERLTSHQCLNHQWFVQEQLAKIKQLQIKKPIQLSNQFIARRIKQAKTQTFSPSSPRSQLSIQSPRNQNPPELHLPQVSKGFHTEKLVNLNKGSKTERQGPHTSSKSIHFEPMKTQQTEADEDTNQEYQNLKSTFHGQFKSARKKTTSFVIRNNQTMKNFNKVQFK